MKRRPLLNARRALTAGVTLATLAALPAAGSAKTHVYPDGPSCKENPDFISQKQLTETVAKGVPFYFVCMFYKNNQQIDEGWLDPSTKDPFVPKLDVSGTLTITAKEQHFLPLSSRVIASGDLVGPTTVTQDDEDLDLYRLRLEPSVAKLLKAQHAGTIVVDYALTVKVLPGTAVTAGGGDSEGGDEGADEGPPAPSGPQHVATPGGTVHVANDPERQLEIIENLSAPCKHFLSGDGGGFGCAAGVGA